MYYPRPSRNLGLTFTLWPLTQHPSGYVWSNYAQTRAFPLSRYIPSQTALGSRKTLSRHAWESSFFPGGLWLFLGFLVGRLLILGWWWWTFLPSVPLVMVLRDHANQTTNAHALPTLQACCFRLRCSSASDTRRSWSGNGTWGTGIGYRPRWRGVNIYTSLYTHLYLDLPQTIGHENLSSIPFHARQ